MDYRTLIREKRKEKGLSQERLAKLVQVSQPFIAEIESGRKKTRKWRPDGRYSVYRRPLL